MTHQLILLISILFFHIFDDFYLQGILAKMKQKEWWKKQTDNSLYKCDYIVALIAHAFSWCTMVHIPCFIYRHLFNPIRDSELLSIVFLFIVMLLSHAVIDDLKANKHRINLVIDQTLHVLQVIILFAVYR